MRNLSPFDQNVILALEGAAEGDDQAFEAAETAYLRFRDRDRLKAEACALDLLAVAPLRRALFAAVERVSPFATACKDVEAFVIERHVRRYFPDGRAA